MSAETNHNPAYLGAIYTISPLQSAIKSLIDKFNEHGKNPTAFAVYGQKLYDPATKEPFHVIRVHFNPQFESLGLRNIVPDNYQGFQVEIMKYWPINAH